MGRINLLTKISSLKIAWNGVFTKGWKVFVLTIFVVKICFVEVPMIRTPDDNDSGIADGENTRVVSWIE